MVLTMRSRFAFPSAVAALVLVAELTELTFSLVP